MKSYQEQEMFISMRDYAKLSLGEKAKFILEKLKKDFPEVSTPLLHSNEYELLFATILSPQTLDETTNKVTPILFKNYPNVEALSKAQISDIEKIIRIVNYYKTKAKNVVNAAKMIVEDFNGAIPSKMSELIKLPGVGRKVANVVICEWFVKHEGIEPEGFVIDTHVMRVTQALRLTKNKTPEKIEKDLMKLFPKNEWADLSLRFIFHGRNVFQAKNPQFENFAVWKEVYGSLGY